MSCQPCGCDFEANHLCQEHSTNVQLVNELALRKVSRVSRNEVFHNLLKKMGDTHDKKNHDYADTASGNYYSNFEISAKIAGCSVDTVFRVLIGVKLARLDELLKGTKVANHESLDDSLLDLAVYSALWTSYRMSKG